MVKKNFKKKVNVFKGESNPFNMKINREKRCILGQKVIGSKGLRGVSRAVSHAKRKDLWHKTKLSVEKANKFLDKRLMDGSLQSEESSIHRLVQERKKKLKKNIFNLNEEDLTHKGMPLDVKTFGFKESDSDEEEQLDAAFVNKAHFGGFSSDSKSQEPKSHNEIMAELILESKKKKQEKKMETEVNRADVENLDNAWKDLISVTGGVKQGNSKSVFVKPDEYNRLTNELRSDKRGTPSSRTKTSEEIEKEEEGRMLKLEEDRLTRMNDDVEYKSKKTMEHISADSIYDDFDLQPIPVDENVNEISAVKTESDYSDSDESVDSQESEDSNEEVEIENLLKIPENNIADNYDGNLPGIPASMEDFEEFINTNNFTSQDLCTALGDILKPYLKAKSEKTLKKLATFFGVLVEYASKYLHTDINISCELAPYLHTIAEISPLHTAEIFLTFLDREHQLFQDSKGLKKKKGEFPSFECILILKYCSVLYSVSDFKHPVVTPAIVFMCNILSSAFPVTFPNITSRLFVCSIIVDCVSQSKRLVPEALCFLNKILKLAIPETKATSGDTKIKKVNLLLNKKLTSKKVADLNIFEISKPICEDSKKLSIISKSVSLLHDFATLYAYLPSYSELFFKTKSICSKLPTKYYIPSLKTSICSLVQEIDGNSIPLHPLIYQNTKPKPLKMFEPSFESKFDKKDNISKKFKLLKRVSQKIRKEEKGVLREMRRDVQMIAAEKLTERLESDAERKRKVKELYHDLATQEGEYKKLMKKS